MTIRKLLGNFIRKFSEVGFGIDSNYLILSDSIDHTL